MEDGEDDEDEEDDEEKEEEESDADDVRRDSVGAVRDVWLVDTGRKEGGRKCRVE